MRRQDPRLCRTVGLTPMQRDTLEQILAAKAEKRPVLLATNLANGEERVIDPALADPQDPLGAAAIAAARDDKGRIVDTPAGEVFLNVFNPPLRMLIVGAVHIAQPLAQMAVIAGFDVTIVDPRRAFATASRFPGVALRHDWPDEGVAEFAPDRRTAIVTLTHDPKLDDAALQGALSSDCFYIGCLGSKKTHAARLERLRRAGFDTAALERIHGPVGLAIGAKSPAEIAVSILAEIVSRLRGGAL